MVRLASATLPPGNETGGWVGPGLCLDFQKRDKSLAPVVIRTLDCAASILITNPDYANPAPFKN